MYIKIKVKAGAREEKVEQVSSDHFAISVKEKAERNQANRRVIEIIKAHFGAKIVKIISGHHSPSKIVSVE